MPEKDDLAFPLDYTAESYKILVPMIDALCRHIELHGSNAGDEELLQRARILASEIRSSG